MSDVTTIPGRVLVTGGCGFIGNHLSRRLVQLGCEVVVLDDLSTGAVDGLGDIADVRIETVLDPTAVRDALRGASLVIHLAGLVGKQLVCRHSRRAYEVSAEGTRTVLDAAREIPAVLFSSSAVYGIDMAGPVSEDAAGEESLARAYDGGLEGYAAGKLAMERLAHRAAQSGQRVVVVRPFNVVGPGQTGRYGMVLPRFVRNALSGEPLVVYDDGLQTRTFGHVDTFVNVLLDLIRNPGAWEPAGQIVNIGSPEPTSILDLANAVQRATRTEAGIRHVPYELVFAGQRDVRERIPDVSRLEALTGSVSWPGVDAIVRDVIVAESADSLPPGPILPQGESEASA